jgi:hypothetical protein
MSLPRKTNSLLSGKRKQRDRPFGDERRYSLDDRSALVIGHSAEALAFDGAQQ